MFPRRTRPVLVLVMVLGACAAPTTVEERLAAECRAGDRPSCDALETGAAATDEPEVRAYREPVLRDPQIGIGVSSDRGVGVGVGFGVGSNVSIGVGGSRRH